MGLYGRCVLPKLLDLTMRHEELMARRAVLVPRAAGRVIEVGIGTGLNLPFYGREVSRVHGVDPSPELLRTARERATRASVPVQLVRGSAECLPFAGGSMDTAVLTWTLCSIPQPAAALAELRRVLTPGGRLLFAEHGLAPDPAVAVWQRRLDPVWQRLAGGCHLARKMDDLLRAAGFELARLATGYLPGPRLLAWGTFMYQGEARVGSALQVDMVDGRL